MGVHQTDATEAKSPAAASADVWKFQLRGASQNNVGDITASVDEESDLPPDFTAYLAQFAR